MSDINISITGNSASFIKKVEEESGLGEREILARALELFKLGWDNKRLAIVDDKENIKEFVVVFEPKS